MSKIGREVFPILELAPSPQFYVFYHRAELIFGQFD